MGKPFISGYREALRNSPRRIARWWWAVGVCLVLSGCAASKQGATEINLNLSGARFDGTATTTITITTTPTSESKQDARADVTATVPLK